MKKDIIIEFVPKEKQHSEYDWANIIVDSDRVGKARCTLGNNEIIIYSIIIFPEFQGNGYGTEFIDKAKEQFDRIIADSVRATAVGFWEKVGFLPSDNGNFVYNK